MSEAFNGHRSFKFVQLQQVQLTGGLAKGDSSTTASTTAGLLAVSISSSTVASKDDGNGQQQRLLFELATEGNDVFTGQRTLEDIRKGVKLDLGSISKSGEPLVDAVVPVDIHNFLQILQGTSNDSSYQISFKVGANDSGSSNPGSNRSVKFALKERMQSGMIRQLWSIDLVPVAATTDTSQEGNGSMFSFALRLFQQQHDLDVQLNAAREQYSLLERDRDGWKETATVLEGVWESEKTTLVQNFCDLYSAKQEHQESTVTKLQQEVELLKSSVEKLKKAKDKDSSAAARSRQQLDSALGHVPDDVDHLGGTFNADMVARLAAGQPVPLHATSSSIGEAASSRPPFRKNPLPNKKRRNPLTGATEFFDADAAVEDVLSSEIGPPVPVPPQSSSVPAKKARTATSTSTAKAKAANGNGAAASKTSGRQAKVESMDMDEPSLDEDSNEKQATTAKRKGAAKPTKKKAAAKDNDASLDDHDTGNSFVDEDLDAEIMADLLSLRPSS